MVLMAIIMLISGVVQYIAEFFQVAFQPLTQVLESLFQLF